MNHDALRSSTANSVSPSRSFACQDLVPALADREEPARVLEQDRAQLTRLAQRRQAVEERLPYRVAKLRRQVARIDPRLVRQLRGQLLADELGQALDLGRLAGHQRVGLDVEDEVGRSSIAPELGHAREGQGVVGRVDLDQRELRGVVLQPFLGRVGAEG